MKRRFRGWEWGALLATALVLVANPLRAGQGGDRPHRPPAEARLEAHLQELGLEPERMEKVRAILEASKRTREEIRSEARAAYEEMHALLELETPDEAAVLHQAERISEIKLEGHKVMLRTLLAVRAQLTPEQRAQLRERMRSEGPPHWLRERPRDVPGEE